jgi:hypothetical protein
LAAVLALVALGATASLARADDSQIRISEVYSDGSASHGDFVELQLLADGQEIPANAAIRICTATGSTCVNYLFPASSLPASVSQRTVLVGWFDNANADFGIPANFNFPIAGGSACYMQSVAPSPNVPIDCVAWGTYTAGAVSVGSPAPALNGTQSLTRSEARGCPTLMEAVDDSDNSAADFSLAPLSPRSNFDTPTEAACPAPVAPVTPGTTAGKCKKKKHHASAVVAKKKCKKKRKARAVAASTTDFVPGDQLMSQNRGEVSSDQNVPVSQLPH